MTTFDEINKRLAALAKKRVLVGIPAENAARADGPISNVELGFIFENGSPARNIPARPSLIPGVRGSQADWVPRFRKAAEAAITGGDTDTPLGQAGQVAVNAVQALILSNIPPPLSPKTVARRRMRTRGSSYRRKAVTPDQTIALVDTGDWLRSHTWVLKDS